MTQGNVFVVTDQFVIREERDAASGDHCGRLLLCRETVARRELWRVEKRENHHRDSFFILMLDYRVSPGLLDVAAARTVGSLLMVLKTTPRQHRRCHVQRDWLLYR